MEYIQGDITNETTGIIIHGVNCQGKMGAGVAKALKTKWPIVYNLYAKQQTGRSMLGKVQFINIDDDLWVGNCWTQEFFGNDGAIYADKRALLTCLHTVFHFAEQYNLTVKSPKIASGLAGLDWDRDVVPIFELVMVQYPNVPVKIFII